jgi:metallo-beta-lactamase family protein
MSFEIQFFGATGHVTGSLYVIRAGAKTVLLECGLVQGSSDSERHNWDEFPVPVEQIDAVILSHAHIDHSGRLPRLVNKGYDGPVIVHEATHALCEIMLPDSGYLNEKDAERENRHRRRQGENPINPLYTLEDAKRCLQQFDGHPYGQEIPVVPGLTVCFHDAGHILGAAVVELKYDDHGRTRTLVFSGDLGYRDAPVMNGPAMLTDADAVILESTYGDRLHRPMSETLEELTEVFRAARASQGNILIPAFTVGRTQDLLYMMAENFDRWKLRHWDIFLDSPMGIEATAVYSRYRDLYGAELFAPGSDVPQLAGLQLTRSSEESMEINTIGAGAIIIAGSGMCTGGRIQHHFKQNIWRPECHVIIVGFQARGTLGRRLVDGADTVRLWGDEYAVRAQVHTIGGLSAHADQEGLIDWYRAFDGRPPVYLVHGEPEAQQALALKMRADLKAPVTIAQYGQKVVLSGKGR